MTEWKEYKLGEVCTELSDGLHKAPVFKERDSPISILGEQEKSISNLSYARKGVFLLFFEDENG